MRGLLTAVDWYDDGSTRRVALLTSDEREFDVEPYEVCRRLVPHARGEVILWGVVDVDGDRPSILVSTFVVLPDG